MRGWFEGSGGLPLIRLEAVTAVSAGRGNDRSVLYVAMRESTVEVYAVDRDRFISELEAFHSAPVVEPSKPAIDARKIGRLDRMPTVEEFETHKGKWRWYSDEFSRGYADVDPCALGHKIFEALGGWGDGDTIEPITEAL